MKVYDLFRWKRPVLASDPSGSAARDLPTDTSSPVRLGIIVLLVGFGGFLLWAGFAPLDEGVPCQGVVSIATKRKVVQHRQGGLVAEVRVHEGAMVKEGDVLVVLDSQVARARYAEVHQRYLGLRAAEGRLLAERDGSGVIRFHRDLLNDSDRALVRQFMRNQQELLVARLKMRQLLREQYEGVSSLVAEGYAPLSQQRDLGLRIAQLDSDSAKELAAVQSEVQVDFEKSKAIEQELEETEVRSPATGQVVGLQVHSAGAVIQPGQKVMDIVPDGEALLIEAKVPPHLIDKVHRGMVASVQFASFANSPLLVVPGLVESVSADLLSDAPSGMQPAQSYYLARIEVTGEGMQELGERRMQPGMPVQAIVKTGERSLLTYILHPLFKRMKASLKEE